METPMNKTEATLAAIFRHCDEVAEGKRQPRSEREGSQVALAWLGVKENDKVSDGGPLTSELKQDANPPFAAPTC